MAFSCLTGTLKTPRKVNGYGADYAIDPLNKTGCRYVIVDAVNTPKVLQFYKDNGFDFIFSSDEEEMQYMSKSEQVEDGDVFRETRLMVCDLMTIKSNI